MTNNFNILVNKLNQFRFKYYIFRLLKGTLLTLFILIALFTVFSLVEYFVYLSSDARKLLFFGFLIFAVLLAIQFIFVPFLKLLHVLRPIDAKTSAAVIRKHFSEIKDKLVNVLELHDMNDSGSSQEILLASIDQKIGELGVFDFSQAVQYKNLRIVLLYFSLSLIITAGIFLVDKSVFLTAPQRIMHYNTQFIKPSPFTYHLVNDDLKVTKGDAFKIMMEARGSELPQVAYINIEGNNYLMKSTGPGNFEFEIASVVNPVNFHFTDLKHRSDGYFLQLLPKPGINHFEVITVPPAYTGIPSQKFENTGDLQVPNGSEIAWSFSGIDIDTLYFRLADSVFIGAEREGTAYNIKRQFLKSTGYHVYIKNEMTEADLALSYSVDVIPDFYPEIKVIRMQDTLKMTRFFFKGFIGDDYGFTALRFHYNIQQQDSSIAIPFVKNMTDQEFYFSFDFADLETSGESVSYYFSVTDNDVINRYKTTTSDHFVFHIPNKEEIAASEKEQFEKLEEMLYQSEKLAGEIKQDLQNLRLKNMDTSVSDWEKSQMVNQILSKQNQLEQLYNRIKNDNEKLNNFSNSFNEQNEQIVEKQKQIEQLLDEVFTDELRKLLEEFQKLAQEFDSKKLNQLTEMMNFTYDDLQKQLDRNLEMLRKMKVEQNMQQVIDNLNRMAAEEEKMAEELSDSKNLTDVDNKLEQHQKEMEQLRNQLNDALQMNDNLEKPLNFDDFEEELRDIENSMEENRQDIQKQNRRKAGSGMKETSEKMRNTAFAMQQMLNSNNMEQNMENLSNLRQILSNLVYLSFEQEDILTNLSGIQSVDPRLNTINRQQKRIKDQSRIVKDSLYALARRTPQINSMVNNEVLGMEMNLDKAIDQMGEGLFPNARMSQQYAMTAMNNLALLLNEALENLEQQMANAQPGGEPGDQPGQGKPGMNLLKEQSENIKQQLQQMIDQMKKGDQQNMGKNLGQSLIQHEMMQQMLREIMNGGGIGNETRKALQEIDEIIEQNRRQLLNRNINTDMIVRQNLINTRLLDAEKAELEREFEEERESRSAEDFYSNPVQFFEFLEKNNSSLEFLNRNSHRLSNFYNNKYKQYMNNIQNE